VTTKQIVSAGTAESVATEACMGWYRDNVPARKEFTLVGAIKGTLDDAHRLGESAGNNMAADPNYSNLPGSTAVYLCAVHGPLAKVALKGSTLIYYTIPNAYSAGVVLEY
jgi:hypothetical protein